MVEAHVISTRCGHFVVPVVLPEYFPQAWGVAVQELDVDPLRFQTAQNASIEMGMERDALARFCAVSLTVPDTVVKVDHGAFRHFYGNAVCRLALPGPSSELVAARHQPGWPGCLMPVLEGPDADSGHGELRVRLGNLRVVSVEFDQSFAGPSFDGRNRSGHCTATQGGIDQRQQQRILDDLFELHTVVKHPVKRTRLVRHDGPDSGFAHQVCKRGRDGALNDGVAIFLQLPDLSDEPLTAGAMFEIRILYSLTGHVIVVQ